MENNKRDIVKTTVKKFKSGGVVVFPTDTVHGIGCILTNQQAIERVYRIKKRAPNQPSQVLIGNLEQAENLSYLDEQAKKLIGQLWPGGLTIVVPAKVEQVPELVRGGTDTVGLRMPNFPLLLRILSQLGQPILATSANFPNEPPAISKETLDEKLADLVDYIIPKDSLGKQASTVVDLTKKPFETIREGIVPKEKISLLLQT